MLKNIKLANKLIYFLPIYINPKKYKFPQFPTIRFYNLGTPDYVISYEHNPSFNLAFVSKERKYLFNAASLNTMDQIINYFYLNIKYRKQQFKFKKAI
jgi:hypothetical protein